MHLRLFDVCVWNATNQGMPLGCFAFWASITDHKNIIIVFGKFELTLRDYIHG